MEQSKTLQIRLLGHCIICLRRVIRKRKRFEDESGASPPTEIAPKSVVSEPGFLTTLNQVWTVSLAKLKERNFSSKNGAWKEIEIEKVFENGFQNSTTVSFSRAPTICKLCCDKVLAVENLMKAVRLQVREMNKLMEEGRRSQSGGMCDFERNLRGTGLEEMEIKATLQFVGISGSSCCPEENKKG